MRRSSRSVASDGRSNAAYSADTDTTTRPSVLITGCSTGIGRSLAAHLTNQGWQVFAGVRSKEQMEQVTHGEAVMLDVTKQDQIDAARDRIQAAVGDAGLTAVINNAAYAFMVPVECIPADRFTQVLDVNVTGILRVTQTFLPLLRQASGARIINLSSLAGTVAMPCWGPYTTSKFAVEALTDCLRMELAGQGIKVVLIKPPAIKTPIWANSRGYMQQALGAQHPRMPAYQQLFDKAHNHMLHLEETAIEIGPVLDTITTALTAPHPRARYMVTWGTAVIVWLRRVLPDWIWDWIILRGLLNNTR